MLVSFKILKRRRPIREHFNAFVNEMLITVKGFAVSTALHSFKCK